MKVLVLVCVLAGMVMADHDYRYVVPIPSHFDYRAIPYIGNVFPPHYNYNPAVIQPGYVAKTLGAEHYAPLPEGLGYASHHINVAPAPGSDKHERHIYVN
ncbi:hypothetical protein Pcinc_036507 [Petrolisthes cinctipes]|uniref:Uncharacterized protein n=1 Tax=Petrolisthes cinctipes TaxID=88211 RepID=A0AAE1BXK7_PETCI|nr:hypothetical protein Pcinc_036507 [Petrolisthes cinctipes]